MLRTDFFDYYDHWFDLDGQAFKRLSTGGMSRGNMLIHLNNHGIATPAFGPVQTLAATIPGIKNLVVYTNERSHRGEGKLLLSLDAALRDHPGTLASVYVGQDHGISHRLLQVGEYSFWLRYQSKDWRSNYGDVDVVLLDCGADYHPTIDQPLFALDFVGESPFLAVDFNIAPGIRGTGVEELLSGKEVVDAIKEAMGITARVGTRQQEKS
jgi:hypothetical protein